MTLDIFKTFWLSLLAFSGAVFAQADSMAGTAGTRTGGGGHWWWWIVIIIIAIVIIIWVIMSNQGRDRRGSGDSAGKGPGSTMTPG